MTITRQSQSLETDETLIYENDFDALQNTSKNKTHTQADSVTETAQKCAIEVSDDEEICL